MGGLSGIGYYLLAERSRRGGQEFGVKGVLYSVTIGSLVGSAPKRRNIITSCT